MLHILTMQKIEMTGLEATVMRLGDKRLVLITGIGRLRDADEFLAFEFCA